MNKEMDYEEFLTPEDFGVEIVTREDLEKINGHPIEDFGKDLIKRIPDKKESNFLSLKEKQWQVIENIKDELAEKKDKRHLFFIKKGTHVERGDKKERYFSGEISCDMLAVNEGEKVKLIKIFPEDEVFVKFYSDRNYKFSETRIDNRKYAKKDGLYRHDLNNVLDINSFLNLFEKR